MPMKTLRVTRLAHPFPQSREKKSKEKRGSCRNMQNQSNVNPNF